MIEATYQPVVDLDNGEVAYYETLLRVSNDQGDDAHGDLLEKAEAEGFIHQLDFRMLGFAANAARQAPQQHFAVNLSRQTVLGHGSELRALLKGLSPIQDRLLLELNGAFTLSQRETLEVKATLRGWKTGLNHYQGQMIECRRIEQLRPAALKLGPNAVTTALSEQSCAALREAIDTAAHQNAMLVAVGLDSAAKVNLARACGVRYGQGHYFQAASAGQPSRQQYALPVANPDQDQAVEACWHCLYGRLADNLGQRRRACA